MGYEEVETVLPADFVPRPDPDPIPEQPKQKEDDHELLDDAPPPSDSVEEESEAEDAACGGLRKKKKKKKKSTSSGRTGRTSMLSRWRASRSKSRSRKKREKEEAAAKVAVADGSDASENKKKKEKRSRSKSRSRLGFRTIRKVDSNATEVRSNTRKAKEDRDSKNDLQSDDAKAEEEVAAINGSAAVLPTVREGSPANTTTTSLTGEKSTGDAAAAAVTLGATSLPAPSPAPTTASAATEISIELGDENEQVEIAVETPFTDVPAAEEEKPNAEEKIEEETDFPPLKAAISRDASVRSARSHRSTRSNASLRSNRSIKSKKSSESSRSIKAAKSTESMKVNDPVDSIKIAKSSDSIRASKSTDSLKPAKSSDSINAAKSKESIKSCKSGENFPGVSAVMSGEASVRSTRSNKSSSSKRSTGSRRSIRSLKSKSKSIEEEDPKDKALVVAQEKHVVEKPEHDVVEKVSGVVEEEHASDKENLAVQGSDSPQKNKWVKKVSLSIGGYKTSFQFSDPMANLADAVNDALDVVGNADVNLVKQACALDAIGGDDGGGEAGEEEERDYDENPTRLFMYLQQRAWGLALTQLQKYPEEARVWVYRKARPEKAANVEDADNASKVGAMVVQHNALVVHDGSDMPKFRWKLLPLHAAIVLGAPTEIIQDIIKAYPGAARKTDERGSLPVHLAASRLDVDPEGEQIVLQLFGAYPDSIELQDRKGRTPPELAKLARARKDIEEQRKSNACSQSQASQMGQECTASQYGNAAEEGERGNEEGGDCGEDDDDRSVKSSLSGRFQQMLRKSKSTDTVDRRKKKKKKDKKGSKVDNGLSASKSMDEGENEAVDDAAIAESLGPGFAFLKTSKSQEVREIQEAATKANSQDEEEVNAPTEEELVVAAKKALVSKEYQMPEHAPSDITDPLSIPLPMSFSMNDDSSCVSASSSRSRSSARKASSPRSSVRGSPVALASRSPMASPRSSPKSSPRASPEPMSADAGSVVSAAASIAAASVVSATSATAQEPATELTAPAMRTVKISEEPHEVHELAALQETSSQTSPRVGSPPLIEECETVNEGLRNLLEKAVENAGRAGMDVTEFVRALENEWVTDVEALRRLDGETLDDLLPLMLSRELQRLINHADSIDSKFLKEGSNVQSPATRGRSPKKSTKKKKKKRSHRRAKKRNHYRPVTPPEGPLTPISEEADPSPGNSDDVVSIFTEARSVHSSRSAPGKLAVPDDEEDDEDEEGVIGDDEQEDDEEDEEDYDEDIPQSASIEDLEIRKLHANLIADARKKFPTREALEDSIRERQAEVEAAVNSGFDVDKQTLARAALADDEVRKLLPLRLILPTVTDLTEMISVLQMHKEDAMRSLDIEKARGIASEIDELQDQINREERYLLKKRMGDTKCTNSPTEKKQSGILKGILKVKDGSSSGSIKGEAVDSRDDDNN